MDKTFVEDERPCDSCVNVTRYGCVSWNCEYINRDEAIKAWREKHEMADRKTENSSEIPNNCEDCRNWNHNYGACTEIECNYEPNNFDKDINVRSKIEPQTDGILFKGNLKEGEYKLIKTSNGWVLEGNDIAYYGEPQTERKDK